MTLTAIEKISVAEFLERDDFEEGYIYELISGRGFVERDRENR